MLYCPGNVAYGTSKAAVAYLTKQVGSEYIQDGVVVNAVAPGRIITGREGSRVEGNGAKPMHTFWLVCFSTEMLAAVLFSRAPQQIIPTVIFEVIVFTV